MGRNSDKDDVDELRVSQELELEQRARVEGDFPKPGGGEVSVGPRRVENNSFGTSWETEKRGELGLEYPEGPDVFVLSMAVCLSLPEAGTALAVNKG